MPQPANPARQIVAILTEMIPNEHGASASARRLKAELLPAIEANPAYSLLWRQFLADPQGQAVVLTGIIQTLLAGDAALAGRVEALLAAAPAVRSPIYTVGGDYYGKVQVENGDFIGGSKPDLMGDGNGIASSDPTPSRQIVWDALRGELDEELIDRRKAGFADRFAALIGDEDADYDVVTVDEGNFEERDRVPMITAEAAARELLRQLPLDVFSDALQAAAVSYFNDLLDRYQYLELNGLEFPERMPLLDLYVPLQARLKVPEGEAWDQIVIVAGREDEFYRLSKSQPILELLQQSSGLIVLGEPGVGKTTFLKYLTLQLVCGQGDPLGMGRRFPVWVPLSGYAAALRGRSMRLDDYVAEHYHTWGAGGALRELPAEALKAGQALILLDGLDGVKEPGLRREVAGQIEEFYYRYQPAGNRFVITSRITGYRDVPLEAEELRACVVDDFDQEQIRGFVERWATVLERSAPDGDLRAARERRELLEAVACNVGVRTLVSNPFLLTVVALMKRQGVTLSERRVELYDQLVKTLLAGWNRARGRELDEAQTLQVLARLALRLYAANPGPVGEADLRRGLEAVHRELHVADPEGAARQFLSDVRGYPGLLVELGPGEYGFIHLAVEAYLAGRAIASLGDADERPVVDCLSRHVGQPVWREPSLLSIGYWGLIQQQVSAAGRVVEALAQEALGEPRGEAVILAGAAILDGGQAGVPSSSRDVVIERLVQTMQSDQVAGLLRRKAGRLLGRLGWVPEDLETFRFVPRGKFLCGDKNKECEILHDYWIGQYPVTNLQYGRFVAAGGYAQRKWWSEAGWEWRENGNRMKPEYWDTGRWNNPIFAVVGVTQYEAEAYCAWLSAQLNAGSFHLERGTDGSFRMAAGPGEARPGWQLRLPTDEEWERAARGTDGRKYPWGDDFEVERANTDRSGDDIGMTAVCTYPQGVSPVGAWDMSGCIWEWAAQGVRRGGSWISEPRYARCTSRLTESLSGFSSFNIGFRVLLS